jgi:hypothetical protein
MHHRPAVRLTLFLAAGLLLLPVAGYPQASQGSVGGRILDPSGAVVAGAQLVLRNMAGGVEVKRVSEKDGSYNFPNLTPGTYELTVTSAGFKPYIQRDIAVRLGADIRIDVKLELGAQTEQVEVTGASPMNYDSGSHEDSIAPDTLEQLPLLVSGTVRSSAAFAILMPGVSTGGQANPFDARINGGMQSGDEAVLDGASMQEGFMSQSGMVSIYQDFPFSPDMVSEVKVVSSSYAPEYGASTSGQVVAVTKSGTDQFHAALFEYYRDDSLNATQWGVEQKPINTQHNFGANVGGPMKVPGLWSNSVKTYFYVNLEGFRTQGGVNAPVVSIPSMKERNGDFSDWRDANGNLIPIYDPATTKVLPDGTVTRQQFPGNIIPADRINPLAQGWLKYLPTPTRDGPLNNYQGTPVPDTILGDSNYLFGRFDSYIGQKDHLAISLWFQRAPLKFASVLPQQLASEDTSDPQNSSVHRVNWDHTFSPDLLSHMAFGYLNRNEGYGCVNQQFANDLPQIPGVISHDVPSEITFSDGFAQWGCQNGINELNVTTRPTYVLNDILTWVKGTHTIKGGFEYRNIGGNTHTTVNEQGTFAFDRGATGLLGINSGNPIASFLLGTVDNANMNVYATNTAYARQKAWIFHLGDTWRVTSKLTVDYGLRWDYFSPSSEKYNRMSFFDPNGVNPDAGGRLGRLAFAGSSWGDASYGAPYPEKPWYGGLAPRLGMTYALTDKTLLRAGWGIFYDRAYYPDWGAGIAQDGFTSNVAFSSTLGGLQPAFLLQDGFPQNYVAPPFIDSGYRNGQDLTYRTLDGNQRARSQQWNLTIDHEIRPGFVLSLAYVGSHGWRLLSNNAPLNALDPALLSLGPALYDEFEPGQTELDGVPVPYDGWVEQMQSCAPSLAQALLPYPQYCSQLQALTENYGKSTYHSLQAKIEKRFSGGTYLLVSYTLSRLYTSASDNIQRSALTWNGASGVISPYEQSRNWALAADDTTHVLSAALVWDVPFGRNASSGLSKALLHGWQLSTIFRYSSGVPFFFRSSQCNVPGQFRVGCIPSINGNPFAQDVGSYDPGKGPLFNTGAFENPNDFNFYYGNGDRITSYRQQSYRNQDISLIKNTKLGGRVNLQLRISAFNVWNWHVFTTSSQNDWYSPAFDTDIASPDFGQWTGSVSNPRNIQLSARLEF